MRRVQVRRFHQIFVQCLVRFGFAVRYIGVRAADGSVEHQADAMALSMLVFRWSVRRSGGESLHESEVRCDHALERGVPHPEIAYCTKAELDHIAMRGCTSTNGTTALGAPAESPKSRL